MKVCKMCGKPEDGFGPCKNCGSYSFIEIGGQKQNRSSVQSVVPPNGLVSPNMYAVPNGLTPPVTSNVAGVSSSIGSSVAIVAKGKAAMGAGKIVAIILSLLLVVAVGIAVPVVVTQTNTPEATIAKLEKPLMTATLMKSWNALILKRAMRTRVLTICLIVLQDLAFHRLQMFSHF